MSKVIQLPKHVAAKAMEAAITDAEESLEKFKSSLYSATRISMVNSLQLTDEQGKRLAATVGTLQEILDAVQIRRHND